MSRYRGVSIERAPMGHVNVFTADGGFVGGFESEAAARRHVDSSLDRPRYAFSHIDDRGRYCYAEMTEGAHVTDCGGQVLNVR